MFIGDQPPSYNFRLGALVRTCPSISGIAPARLGGNHGVEAKNFSRLGSSVREEAA